MQKLLVSPVLHIVLKKSLFVVISFLKQGLFMLFSVFFS